MQSTLMKLHRISPFPRICWSIGDMWHSCALIITPSRPFYCPDEKSRWHAAIDYRYQTNNINFYRLEVDFASYLKNGYSAFSQFKMLAMELGLCITSSVHMKLTVMLVGLSYKIFRFICGLRKCLDPNLSWAKGELMRRVIGEFPSSSK